MNKKESARRWLKSIVPAKLRYDIKLKKNSATMKEIEELKKIPYRKGTKSKGKADAAGINLIGPILSATGLGQSFRLLEAVFAETDFSYTIIPFEGSRDNFESDEKYQAKISQDLKYPVNLWHVNPAEFVDAYRRFGREAFDNHYNIAFWLWEVEEFPEEWIPIINLLDEIWTPAEYISRTLRKVTDKPVHTVPYAVTAEADTEAYGRKFFKLPQDKFLFLMMYDTNSIMERKNPQAVIEAYKRAFYTGDTDGKNRGASDKDANNISTGNENSENQKKPALVIKVNSASKSDWKKIDKLLSGIDRDNVYFVDGNLSKLQVNSLIADVDAFASLHRAEGFGLVMAEAMLSHTPCIATDYSANTEFMNGEVAYMIGYDMVTLNHIIPPYHKGIQWADPDVDQAAEAMKELYGDWYSGMKDGLKNIKTFETDENSYGDADECPVDKYRKLADDAYSYVTNQLGAKRVKSIVEERLKETGNGDIF